MTTKVEESVQVDVPLSTAYNQSTQFEDFPHFMGGVKEVRQLDERRLHWVAEIGGVRREWEASILEQVPDARVAWAATSGATNAGAVRFVPVDASSTVVYLTLEYEPEGLVEQIGDKLGIVRKQVTGDLQRFKSLIKDQGYASGAWRGTVNEAAVASTPGVEDAAASRGDSGKAGVSGKAVAAGAAVAAVAAAGVMKSRSGESEQGQPVETDIVPAEITPASPVEAAPLDASVPVVPVVEPDPIATDDVITGTGDTREHPVL